MMNADNLIQPIVLTWPLIVIASLYAIIRAKHDSYINNGPWKRYAFLEGVFWAVVVSMLYRPVPMWWEVLFLPVIFGLWFWIVFDIMCGVFRVGKIFYFGQYDSFAKNFRHPAVYLFFKVVWLLIIQGVYYNLYIKPC